MKKIGEVIDSFYKSHNLFKKEQKSSLIEIWSDVVGDHIAKKTTKIRVQNNTLIVYVNHPIIKNELNYAKTSILNQIREKYKEKPLSDLKII